MTTTKTKTANVNVHIAPELKREAEQALAKLYLTPEDAIEDFYRQIALAYQHRGDAWLDLPQVTCCLCWGRISNSPGPDPNDREGDLRFESVAELRAYFENDILEDDDEDNDGGVV